MKYQSFGIHIFEKKNVSVAVVNKFIAANKKINFLSMIEEFNGLSFLMCEEFDGWFLIRAFLIERDCVYNLCACRKLSVSFFSSNDNAKNRKRKFCNKI